MHSTSVIIILVAVLYFCGRTLWTDKEPGDEEHTALLLKDMQSVIGGISHKPGIKIAVGYNANLDVVALAVPFFEQLMAKHAIDINSIEFSDRTSVSSPQELCSLFAHWFKAGGAAERIVTDGQLFNEIVEVSKGLAGDSGLLLGGNAGLMGNTLAKLDAKVLLGTLPLSTIKDKLHPNVQLPDESDNDNKESDNDNKESDNDNKSTDDSEDSVGLHHIILEYQKGERFGEWVAPRANRLILTRDPINSRLLSLERMHKAMDKFGEDAVVLSGLHLLESESNEVRTDRLEAVKQGLSVVQASSPIHLELASMTDSNFLRKLASTMFPLVDSLGLNEHELLFLAKSLGGPSSAVNEAMTSHTNQGAVSAVIRALEFVLRWSRESRLSKNGRGVERIHFHCLAFHIVAIVQGGSSIFGSTPRASVAAGSFVAPSQACGVGPERELSASQLVVLVPKTVDVVLGDDRYTISSDTAVTTIVWEGVKFHISPVLVCKHPVRTVGLGDAISSTGLFHHLKPPN